MKTWAEVVPIIQQISEDALEQNKEWKPSPVPKQGGGRDPQGTGAHERPIRASTGEADDPLQSKTLFKALSRARKKHRTNGQAIGARSMVANRCKARNGGNQ